MAIPAVALSIIGLPGWQPAGAQGSLADRDGSAPIEIEADLLTLEQDKSLAIFEGHVLAIQGELTLRANRLRVHYSGDGANGGQSITLIEADGDVVVASEEETATGKTGVYNILDDSMQLTGDVVLTRGESVLRGDRLDTDLATNTHRLSVAQNGSKQRVRALFVPSQDADEP